jgi:hypothetical protein
MQRTSFDFDVVTGPSTPRVEPVTKPKPDTAQNPPRQDKGAGK